MALHQDLLTSAERRRIYAYVYAVAAKSLFGVCIYIGIAEYVLGDDGFGSPRSLTSKIALVIAILWLISTMLFSGGLLALYWRRISVFSGQKGLCTRFERHVFLWTGILIFTALCFSNPTQIFIYAGKLVRPSWNPSVILSTAPSFISEAIFFTGLIMYGWVMMHGFRLEDGWSLRRFYLPKILLFGALSISKVVLAFGFGLYLSSLPLASFLSMLMLVSLTKPENISSSHLRVLLAITLLELLTTVAMVHDFAKTQSMIRKKQGRVRTLRFRFFAHRFAIILAGIYMGYLGLAFFLQAGLLGESLTPNTRTTILLLTRQEAMMVFIAYSVIEAFLNLPGRKYRLLLYRPVEEDLATLPVAYSDHEGSVVAIKHKFVLERHIELLNFNFIAEYLSTPDKKPPFGLHQALDREGYTIVGKTDSMRADTCRAFVFASHRDAKVIVCLLGPSEFQTKGLPGPKPNDVETSMRHILDAQRAYSRRKASVHHGFAMMYSEVAQELNSILGKCWNGWEGSKPILYFTGHSLGGALATISSIDAAVRMNLSQSDVIVGTFGAPCIGNTEFVRFYNERVPLHWRIVVDGDAVVKMPGKKYYSVGLDAVLTDTGELVLDPTSILSPRVKNGIGFSIVEMAARHKKVAYLLAMRAWAGVHRRGQYAAESANWLWDWPVPPEESMHLPQYPDEQIL